MKRLLALTVVLWFAASGHAQNYNRSGIVFKTGFGDVVCAGGVCLVPTENGYLLQNQGVAIIPQSTAFFGLSNPKVIEFRVREFLAVPNTNAIITTDSFGNQVFLNAGIHDNVGVPIQSRGQKLFVR